MQHSDDQRTALYQEHVKLKAKMVPFGGWLMPVSYDSVLKEHENVRERVGIFDVSHMGEIHVHGPKSFEYLQGITINDLSRLQDGHGQYSAICHEDGGMIDDLIIYRLAENDYFVCVNASNTEKDFAWFKKQAAAFKSVNVDNESSQWSQIAIQGPRSLEALKEVLSPTDFQRIAELPYTHISEVHLAKRLCRLARTGYTGEKGFELYLPNEIAAEVWQQLLATAPKTGILPIGLGARDTLRLEACYLLYGNDMNDTVSPLEAGIAWATKLDAGPFIGRDALLRQKEEGVKRKIFAFVMEEQGIPRHGMQVYKDGELIGEVTSGSVLPTLGGAGGMALLASSRAQLNDSVTIDVRGKSKKARLMKRPLYDAKVKG